MRSYCIHIKDKSAQLSALSLSLSLSPPLAGSLYSPTHIQFTLSQVTPNCIYYYIRHSSSLNSSSKAWHFFVSDSKAC